MMERGFAQPATKANKRSAPIADGDKERRNALRAFQSGDAVSERRMEPA